MGAHHLIYAIKSGRTMPVLPRHTMAALCAAELVVLAALTCWRLRAPKKAAHSTAGFEPAL